MIQVEYINPIYQDRHVFPSVVAQPIFAGDFVRSRSGAEFKVRTITHSSRMIQVPDSDTWSEIPVVVVELIEK